MICFLDEMVSSNAVRSDCKFRGCRLVLKEVSLNMLLILWQHVRYQSSLRKSNMVYEVSIKIKHGNSRNRLLCFVGSKNISVVLEFLYDLLVLN